ncbi:MAG TPA: BrnA antitoxin family protein [Candidatus Krumholzibacteria bacterium]|nr:BrnA antitoxin family protein [Candidatus Krumholzibacteria bacterium]
MKKEYDFSKGRRGAIIPVPKNKVRITIRIDNDILDWFREQVYKAQGGNYQTLMNDALRAYIEARDNEAESLVRRVVREELAEYSVRKKRSGKPKKR